MQSESAIQLKIKVMNPGSLKVITAAVEAVNTWHDKTVRHDDIIGAMAHPLDRLKLALEEVRAEETTIVEIEREHDRRVTELLKANEVEVERRRKAEFELQAARDALEAWWRSPPAQMTSPIGMLTVCPSGMRLAVDTIGALKRRVPRLEALLERVRTDVFPHVRDTGHNVADREMSEAMRDVRAELP